MPELPWDRLRRYSATIPKNIDQFCNHYDDINDIHKNHSLIVTGDIVIGIVGFLRKKYSEENVKSETLTMTRIGLCLGVSRATAYRYMDNRKESGNIPGYLLERAVRRMRRVYGDEFRRTENSDSERTLVAFRALVDECHEHCANILRLPFKTRLISISAHQIQGLIRLYKLKKIGTSEWCYGEGEEWFRFARSLLCFQGESDDRIVDFLQEWLLPFLAIVKLIEPNLHIGEDEIGERAIAY